MYTSEGMIQLSDPDLQVCKRKGEIRVTCSLLDIVFEVNDTHVLPAIFDHIESE